LLVQVQTATDSRTLTHPEDPNKETGEVAHGGEVSAKESFGGIFRIMRGKASQLLEALVAQLSGIQGPIRELGTKESLDRGREPLEYFVETLAIGLILHGR
jgi:hypothetical protein